VAQTLFFVAETFGYYGYTFEDFNTLYTWQKDAKSPETTCGSVEIENAFDATVSKTTNPIFLVLKCIEWFWTTNQKPPTTNDIGALIQRKTELLKQFNTTNPKTNDEFIRNFVNQIATEISPVCAVVGGVGAQEIIKLICHNDEPFNNFFFFNAIDDVADIQKLIRS